MLNSLRKGAGTWVAKIFIGLLVLSFAVWGIADIFTGYGASVIAKVGDVEVSQGQFERQLQQQVRRLSAQFGQQISRQQARTFGLDRQVLNSLITNAALSSHAKQLGLGISNQSIRDEIAKSPAFQGADGKFSRLQFNEILRNNDMNERMYVAEQRVGAVRDQLVLSLSSDLYVPVSMKETMNRFDKDTRTLEYFILPKSVIKKIDEPDEKTQQDFLEANKPTFTASEFRKFGVLTLSSEIVRKSIKITKEDIAADYAARLDQFSIPGQRHIRRMSFIDRDKAKEARKDLDEGADFMAVAKKYGFKSEGTDMGFIDKTALFDPKIADAAFSLKEGELSQPIENSLSTVLLQVVAIKPGKIQKKLEEVEAEIRTYLLTERAADKIGTLHDSIEDERAAGKSLALIAKDLDLSYTVTPAADPSGKDLKGNKVAGLSTDVRFLKAIFDSDIGVENEPVEVSGGVVHWFEVLGVTPSRLKSLAEVKEPLVTLWKDRQRDQQLNKIANDVVKELRGSAKLATFANKYKTKLLKSKPFTRSQEHDDIPTAAVNQAFVLPVGGIGMNSLPGDKGRVIFKVVAKKKAPEPQAKDSEKLATRISRALENDMVAQYVADLRKTYGVTINEKIFQRLSGVTQ